MFIIFIEIKVHNWFSNRMYGETCSYIYLLLKLTNIEINKWKKKKKCPDKKKRMLSKDRDKEIKIKKYEIRGN